MNLFLVSLMIETPCPIIDAGQVSAAIQTEIVKLLDSGRVVAVVHAPKILDVTEPGKAKRLYPDEGGAR